LLKETYFIYYLFFTGKKKKILRKKSPRIFFVISQFSQPFIEAYGMSEKSAKMLVSIKLNAGYFTTLKLLHPGLFGIRNQLNPGSF